MVKFYLVLWFSGKVISGEVLSGEVMSGEVLSSEVLSGSPEPGLIKELNCFWCQSLFEEKM
jgi:hypothetical protein